MDTPPDILGLENQLVELCGDLSNKDDPSSWNSVTSIAKTLANLLRVKGEGEQDYHSVLGRRSLPQSLRSLFSLALREASIPNGANGLAIFEVLRVAANLCMDHDNRAQILDTGLPQAVVSLLEGYLDTIPPGTKSDFLHFNVSHLKIIRTSIGFLLNACIGYEPIKARLTSLEAGLTILKISNSIYPVLYWYYPPTDDKSVDRASLEESWTLRSGISNWSWRLLAELGDGTDDRLVFLRPDALPVVAPTLLKFCHPYPSNPHAPLFEVKSPLYNTLLQADFEVLEETCTLLESLSLDIEDVRLELAQGFSSAEPNCALSTMLDFIEFGSYLPCWKLSDLSEAEVKRKEKAFDICKAALIKSVVEVSGEEKNEAVLWDDSDESQPGGKFVTRMVGWIKGYINGLNSDSTDTEPVVGQRDDLVICACLSLGNLSRKEKISTALLSHPYSLAPFLSSVHVLAPACDIKLKHAVLGLLKNISQSIVQSPQISAVLVKAGVVQRIVESNIWDEGVDAMANVVQLGAIGVVKHLCNANVDSAFALVLPSAPNSKTGLSQILSLVERSEHTPTKSEGTRVLVNVIKTLWAYSPAGGSIAVDVIEEERKKEMAISVVLTSNCVHALTSLIGRSWEYPVLINEGLVALSLISARKEGGPLVLKALNMPNMQSGNHLVSPSSGISSPISDGPSRERGQPQHVLDVIVSVLQNTQNTGKYPIEVRFNACTFFLQLGRNSPGEGMEQVKETVGPVLRNLVETLQDAQGKEEILLNAAKRVLDSWA